MIGRQEKEPRQATKLDIVHMVYGLALLISTYTVSLHRAAWTG